MIIERYHHADSFMEGVAYDRKARGVKVIEVLFGIEVPRRSPWLQKFTEEADLPPTGDSERLWISARLGYIIAPIYLLVARRTRICQISAAHKL